MSALLFFSLIFFSGGFQGDAQAAGMQALDHQDYQKAEEIFGKIAASDPKDYAAQFNLALSEAGLKKDELAGEHFKQALTLKPGLYEAELNLGIIYLRHKRPADAIPLLRDAEKQKADQPRPKRYLGDALLATADFAGAEAVYRQALLLDAKIAPAELGLGQSLKQQGKLDDALPHYKRAFELEPPLKSYLLEMASAFLDAKRPGDAISLLKEFPDDPAAREQLGQCFLTTGKPAEAVTEFEAAARLSPTPANQLALATAYLKNNQPEQATPILERALQSNPDDFDVRMAVGRIKRDRKDYSGASTQFVAAARLKPSSVEAWNEAATSLTMGGQYEQALSALDQVKSLNAEGAGNFYLRAIILDKLHQPKLALASYQRFLQVSHGEHPDQEFIARHRSIVLEKEANR